MILKCFFLSLRFFSCLSLSLGNEWFLKLNKTIFVILFAWRGVCRVWFTIQYQHNWNFAISSFLSDDISLHLFGFVDNVCFEVSLEIMPMTFLVLSQIIVPLLRSKLSALNWQNIVCFTRNVICFIRCSNNLFKHEHNWVWPRKLSVILV